ncbi:MAG: carbonic anhydrase [Stappiaceae bacterium]
MSSIEILKTRNRAFAESFSHRDMPALPKLGTLILTCIDARVDPAHVLGLELGDAVVFRNNGGRVTQAFIDEVSALAALVARMTGVEEAGFDIVLMEHTKCGAQAFADPEFRAQLKERIDVDVSGSAIANQEDTLLADIVRLRDAPHLPGTVTVAAMLYDVESGSVREVAQARALAELRKESA